MGMNSRRTFIKSAAAGTAGLALAMSGFQAKAGSALVMTREKQQSLSPDQALEILVEGNNRFTSGKMLNTDLLGQVKQFKKGQFPFASVITCLDSRTQPEYIFDLGIGDIFCGRIAGNFVNTDMIGSLEFATKISGSRLVLILGHTHCGAIMGACDNVVLGNLTQTLSNLMPAVYAVPGFKGKRNSENDEFVQKVADENVRLNVKAVTERSSIMAELVDKGQLKVVGGMYNISTGKVEFFL